VQTININEEMNHQNTPEFVLTYFNSLGELSRVDFKDTQWKINDNKWTNEELGLSFSLEIAENKEELICRIPIDFISEEKDNRFASVTIVNNFMSGNEGDDAEFILPCDIGVSCKLSGKEEGEYFLPGFSASKWPPFVMNMLMVAKHSSCGSRLMYIDDCRYSSGFRLRTNYGLEHRYQLDPVFWLRKTPDDILPKDSPSVVCRKISGGLSEVASYYRNYLINNHGATPLHNKFQKFDELKKSAETLMIRLRMATKPVPSPVAEQTLENQPTVRKLMDFDAAIRLAEECANQQLEDVDFTFVGWNFGGHDGAFPQILPIEEAVGGIDAMKRAVNRIKELGYCVGVHDNFTDSYTLANNLDHSDWAQHPDGTTVDGEIWGGGLAHLLCPKRSLEHYVLEHLNDLQQFGLNGAYYVDVISLNNLYACHSSEHPISLRESAEYWKKILLAQREFSGVAMSEGTREWALPEVDRAYAATNRPDSHTGLPFADNTVPLFPLIFHGLVLYNSCRMTVNAMPGDKLYLDNIAFGGLPLLYFYQRFREVYSELNDVSDDLIITTQEKLQRDVARIKRVAEDIKKLAPLQSVFIDNYEKTDNGLLCVSYQNGSKLYVNYSDKSIPTPEGISVPEKDFFVSKP